MIPIFLKPTGGKTEIKKESNYIHTGSITIQMKRWREERQGTEKEEEEEE